MIQVNKVITTHTKQNCNSERMKQFAKEHAYHINATKLSHCPLICASSQMCLNQFVMCFYSSDFPITSVMSMEEYQNEYHNLKFSVDIDILKELLILLYALEFALNMY